MFIYSEKATKFLRNLHLFLTGTSASQKKVEISQNFCGLLRIYELYIFSCFIQACFFDTIISKKQLLATFCVQFNSKAKHDFCSFLSGLLNGRKSSNFFKIAVEGSDSMKRNYGAFTFSMGD